MKKLLIPLVLLLLGTGAGVGTGLVLAPAAPEPEEHAADAGAEGDHATEEEGGEHAEDSEEPDHAATEEADDADLDSREYVKLNNQFVVPVVEESSVAALVVLSLSVEVTAGQRDTVFAHEPKLRDVFLQVLFEHANIGGFSGNFTASTNMESLRRALGTAAREVMGDRVVDVLIIDIVRQDV